MKIPEQCFDCVEGHYEVVTRDYEHRGSDGTTTLVSNVKILRCTNCGAELIPASTNRYISRYVAEQTDQLGKADLYAMLEASGLNQKQFAEAIGLGEKTFHRWLKGTQVVSRSMGNYLRALLAFPEVFQWVKERKWRTAERVVKPIPARRTAVVTCAWAVDITRFPALENTAHRPQHTVTNPARGFAEARIPLIQT